MRQIAQKDARRRPFSDFFNVAASRPAKSPRKLNAIAERRAPAQEVAAPALRGYVSRSPDTEAKLLAPESGVNPFWRRNLYVCLFGSFVNMAGMTVLLPFPPH